MSRPSSYSTTRNPHPDFVFQEGRWHLEDRSSSAWPHWAAHYQNCRCCGSCDGVSKKGTKRSYTGRLLRVVCARGKELKAKIHLNSVAKAPRWDALTYVR